MPDAPTVSAPDAAALLAEAARYPWWAEKWAAIDPASRTAYDRWVGAARGRRAGRRARLVSRRIWNGRPWAGPLTRRRQALWDMVDGDHMPVATDVAVGPAGWAP